MNISKISGNYSQMSFAGRKNDNKVKNTETGIYSDVKSGSAVMGKIGQAKVALDMKMALLKAKPMTREEFKERVSSDENGVLYLDGEKFTGKVERTSGGFGAFNKITERYVGGKPDGVVNFSVKSFDVPEFPSEQLLPVTISNEKDFYGLISDKNLQCVQELGYGSVCYDDVIDMAVDTITNKPYTGILIRQIGSENCDYIQQAVYYKDGVECARSREVKYPEKDLKRLS